MERSPHHVVRTPVRRAGGTIIPSKVPALSVEVDETGRTRYSFRGQGGVAAIAAAGTGFAIDLPGSAPTEVVWDGERRSRLMTRERNA
jgi:hypothetical protein